MAGGPIFPRSSFPVGTGNNRPIFPSIHIGSGNRSRHDRGLGVEGNLSVNSVWRLRFRISEQIPIGTATLFLRALSNSTGNAKVQPKWAVADAGEDPSQVTLFAEGETTITWSSGDEDKYVDTKIILDADPYEFVEDGELIMDLLFVSSGWTLSGVSTWVVSLIWEG